MTYTKERKLCDKCGADIEYWEAEMRQEHYCPGMEQSDREMTFKVIKSLLIHGVSCCLPTDLVPEGLENYVQGEG